MAQWWCSASYKLTCSKGACVVLSTQAESHRINWEGAFERPFLSVGISFSLMTEINSFKRIVVYLKLNIFSEYFFHIFVLNIFIISSCISSDSMTMVGFGVFLFVLLRVFLGLFVCGFLFVFCGGFLFVVFLLLLLLPSFLIRIFHRKIGMV